MTDKKYAIVRVDKDWCPYYSDKEFIIPCSNFCENRFECKDCRYGDTKEQFTRKIETAIEIAINEYEKGNIPKGKENRRCAEIIIEFLGVE